jgi:hypothetical protein
VLLFACQQFPSSMAPESSSALECLFRNLYIFPCPQEKHKGLTFQEKHKGRRTHEGTLFPAGTFLTSGCVHLHQVSASQLTWSLTFLSLERLTA